MGEKVFFGCTDLVITLDAGIETEDWHDDWDIIGYDGNDEPISIEIAVQLVC